MKIGFPFLLTPDAGASLFLKNLRTEIERTNIASTSVWINPFVSVVLSANAYKRQIFKPSVFRVDGVFLEQNVEANLVIRRGISEANLVIYQSEFSRQVVEEVLDVKAKRSVVIYNGASTFPKCVSYNAGEKFVFITSARWRPHKRLLDMIKVVNAYSQFNNNIEFRIIGAEGKDTEFVKYLGNKDHSEVLREVAKAHCYLFFSWIDWCPNSVVEALTCSVPVICTNIGGTKELVHETNGGFVIESDDRIKSWQNVDLKNPPAVDVDKALESIRQLVNNYDKVVSNMKPDKLSIAKISEQYVAALKSTL